MTRGARRLCAARAQGLRTMPGEGDKASELQSSAPSCGVLTACEGMQRPMRQVERLAGWQAVLVVSRCAFTGRVCVRLLPTRPTVVKIGLAGSLQKGGLLPWSFTLEATGMEEGRGGAYLRQGQLKGETPPLRHFSDSWPLGSAEWTTAAAALWGEGHTPTLRKEREKGQVV